MLEFKDSNINEYQELIDSGKPLILMATAEWCGPCRIMKPLFKKLSEQMKDQLSFGIIDTDWGSQIASSLKISAIPTLIFIRNSQVNLFMPGVNSEEKIVKHIKELLNDE